MVAVARTGPRSPTATDDRVGRVDDGVDGRRRVVVGVAVVAAVDQPPVAGDAVEGEGAVVGVDGHGDQAVGQGHRARRRRPSTATGWASGAGANRAHPKPGTCVLAGQDAADRRLVEA